MKKPKNTTVEFRTFRLKALTQFNDWAFEDATEADLERVSKEKLNENLKRLEEFLLKQEKGPR